MKRFIAFTLVLILLLGMLAGCDLDITDTLVDFAKDVSSKIDEETGTTEAEEKLTVHEIPTEDLAGNSVEIPASISRCVSLCPGVTDTLISLGVSSTLVGVDSDSYRLEGVPSALNLFSGSDLQEGSNLQLLLQSSPDVVFLDAEDYALLSIAPELLEADDETGESTGSRLSPIAEMTNAGICVCCVPEPKTLAAVMQEILFVGYSFQQYDRSEELVYDIIDMMEAVQTLSDNVTNVRAVYVELEPWVSSGFGEIVNELIGMTGAQNIFLSRDNLINPTTEEVVEHNPAIIITCVGDAELGEGETIHTLGEARMAEISSREGWQDISAVVSGTLYYMESSLVPGPSITDAIWEMAQMCYPSIYTDADRPQ